MRLKLSALLSAFLDQGQAIQPLQELVYRIFTIILTSQDLLWDKVLWCTEIFHSSSIIQAMTGLQQPSGNKYSSSSHIF